MEEFILIVLYIGHIFLSRRLCRLSCRNGLKNVSYDLWWSWFVPPAGILWSLMDYLVSLPDAPAKYKRKTKRNWFSGKDW